MSSTRVRLEGVPHRPVLLLSFSRDAVHAQTGEPLRDWVRGCADRRWDPERRVWLVSGIGPRPLRQLRRAGFDLASHELLADLDVMGLLSLDELVPPIARWFPSHPDLVLVRPRLLGWRETLRLLGPTARLDRGTGRVEAPLADLAVPVGEPQPGTVPEFAVRAGCDVDDDTIDQAMRAAWDRAAQAAAAYAGDVGDHAVHAARSGRATGLGEDTAADSVQALQAAGFTLPDWFGFTPFPFQRLGMLSAVAGHRLLADEQGLGKSSQAAGAAGALGATRVLVISPPVMLSSWVSTVEMVGLTGNLALRS